MKKFLILIFSLSLVACDDGTNYAPVTELSTIEAIPKTGVHKVQQHETLYEIAWKYGLDYRTLAERNKMQEPFMLRSGEAISLRTSESTSKPSTVQNAKPETNKPIEREPSYASNTTWAWPAKGRVVLKFSRMNKGINIAGESGAAINAAAAGKVVYCGNGLRGYGNLIILKHNGVYLSAYAHNRRLLVKEGDWVQQGQKIAEMGNTGSDRTMLHFEIRRAGKPIDPLSLYRVSKV